jgi:hypothetical protein
MSKGEEILAVQLRGVKIPFDRQVMTDSTGRKWRWDFKIDDIVIDVQGGTWNGGRHVTGAGYQNDCDKLNSATRDGYRPLHFTTKDVKSGKALRFIEEMLCLNPI